MRAIYCVKSSAKAGLNNLSVVITRPLEQAGELAALVSRHGGHPLIFPTIEITSCPFTDQLADRLRAMELADWVIFISTYAVRHGLECARLAGANLHHPRIASIGGATTKALLDAGERVALECPPPAGSESLLGTSQMQDVAGRTIIIIRGTGGRELLGNTLRQRGAAVEYVECYERRCPLTPIDTAQEALSSEDGAVIVSTSVNGLENLMKMARRQSPDNVLDARLVVAGKRQLREAARLGWRGDVTAARDAGNRAVLDKLLELSVSR